MGLGALLLTKAYKMNSLRFSSTEGLQALHAVTLQVSILRIQCCIIFDPKPVQCWKLFTAGYYTSQRILHLYTTHNCASLYKEIPLSESAASVQNLSESCWVAFASLQRDRVSKTGKRRHSECAVEIKLDLQTKVRVSGYARTSQAQWSMPCHTLSRSYRIH